MKPSALTGFAMFALLSACVGAAENGTTTPSTGSREDTASREGSFQNERVHQEAQVRIWVPDRWRVHSGADSVMVMSDPHGEVSIMFAVVEGEDLLGALLAVTEGVLDEVDDVRLSGSPQSASFHGMDALLQDGAGVVRGVDVDLSVGVVLTPADKYLLIVGVADSGALPRHADTLLAILEGLEPFQG